ncbi:MAG: hypothetical protein PHX62_05530 [Bacilli bacterium]|nr:hypothetical protein [Bacilli bacterium]
MKIGLERGGHSGGNWYYLADINDNSEEVHFSGRIQFVEYIESTKKEKNREIIGLIIISIILLPITIILLLVALVKNGVFQSNSKRRILLLDNFMVEYMGCQSDNYKQPKRLPALPYVEKIKLLKYNGLSGKTIHLYFSKDFMKRIEIYSNNAGSYSYSLEKLEMFEGEELFWTSTYGFWTNVNTNNSYFENIDSIICEIKNELVDFEEDLLFSSKE